MDDQKRKEEKDYELYKRLFGEQRESNSSSIEYNVVEHAQEIAEDREVYSSGSRELTKEEEDLLLDIFDTKDKNQVRLFNNKLVRLVGLKEAIFLHQLRGFLRYNKKLKNVESPNGYWKAVYESYDQWLEILPIFKSVIGFKKMVYTLEKLGLVLSKRIPYGKFYGIDFKALAYYLKNPEEFEKVKKKLL